MTDIEDEPSEPQGGVRIAIVMQTLFPTGPLRTTPGAEAALREAEQSLIDLLARHISADWGNMSDDDRKMNDEALASSEDWILSAYALTTGANIWIITEWDKSVTTALLPDEY